MSELVQNMMSGQSIFFDPVLRPDLGGVNSTLGMHGTRVNFGDGMMNSIMTSITNALMSKFDNISPAAFNINRSMQMHTGAEMGSIVRGFEQALEKVFPKEGDRTFASNMIGMRIRQGGGVTPELLDSMARFGMDRLPSMQQAIIDASPNAMLRRRYGNMAPFMQHERPGFAESMGAAKRANLSVGEYSSVGQLAMGYNFSERFLSTANTKESGDMLANLRYAKNLTGAGAGQVFELLTSIYDDVISEQLPKIDEFARKLHTLQTRVPGGVQKWAAHSQQINQQLRSIGVNDTAYGAQLSYNQIVSSSAVLEAMNAGGVRNYNYGVEAGRAKKELMTNLASGSTKVTNWLMNVMGAGSVSELQEKLKEKKLDTGVLAGLANTGFLDRDSANQVLLGHGPLSKLSEETGLSVEFLVNLLEKGEINNAQAIADATFNLPGANEERLRVAGIRKDSKAYQAYMDWSGLGASDKKRLSIGAAIRAGKDSVEINGETYSVHDLLAIRNSPHLMAIQEGAHVSQYNKVLRELQPAMSLEGGKGFEQLQKLLNPDGEDAKPVIDKDMYVSLALGLLGSEAPEKLEDEDGVKPEDLEHNENARKEFFENRRKILESLDSSDSTRAKDVKRLLGLEATDSWDRLDLNNEKTRKRVTLLGSNSGITTDSQLAKALAELDASGEPTLAGMSVTAFKEFIKGAFDGKVETFFSDINTLAEGVRKKEGSNVWTTTRDWLGMPRKQDQ